MKMVAHKTIVINGNGVFGCQALGYADKAVPIRTMLKKQATLIPQL